MENSNWVIADDRAVAERALADYGLSSESTLRLLNLSENATYAVDDAATGERSILRVHRQNYHLPHQIGSELDWLGALRLDSDITVPTVLPAGDGRRVVTVNVDGTDRHVVHFAMVSGAEPDEPTVTVDDFHTLGQITAALHEHSHAWTRPAGFSRFSWDWQHSLGTDPRWGRWQDADGVGADEHRLLDRAEQLLRERGLGFGDLVDERPRVPALSLGAGAGADRRQARRGSDRVSWSTRSVPALVVTGGGSDGQHVAQPQCRDGRAQVGVGAVDLVPGCRPRRGAGGHGAGDHPRGQFGFGGELGVGGYPGASRRSGSSIQACGRYSSRSTRRDWWARIGQIHCDLGVFDPARGAGVLALRPDGVGALLQVTGLVDDQYPSSSPRWSTTYERRSSRTPSASHFARDSRCCIRSGLA